MKTYLLRTLLTALLAPGAAANVSSAVEPGAARPDQNRFTRTVLVEGLNEPMQMEFDATRRVYWIERSNGGIRQLDEKSIRPSCPLCSLCFLLFSFTTRNRKP